MKSAPVVGIADVKRLYWKLLDAVPPPVRNHVTESARAIAMLAILRPSADYLSSRTARKAAELIGVVRDMSPHSSRFTRASLKRTFQLSDGNAKRTARHSLATRYSDFVALRRIVRGREDPASWNVIETNAGAIRSLRESGASYIVATGHFSREPQIALYLPHVMPGRVLAVYGNRPPEGCTPQAVRGRAELGQMLQCLTLAHRGNVEFFFVGQGTMADLTNHLRGDRAIVVVHVDPIWQRQKRRYVRPFAGHTTYPVSTGTATLARLSQRPIVTCVPYITPDRTVVLEWGDIIQPPAADDEQADIAVTDELLNRIERAVGLRPEQFVLPIGDERRWDAATCQWRGDALGVSARRRVIRAAATAQLFPAC